MHILARAVVVAGVGVLIAAAQVVPTQGQATPAAAPPTFADVAPIFHKHCTSCHRPGQIAPMSLRTYEESRPWARAIVKQVVGLKMPPWGADPAIGHFANDPSLTRDEVATIVRWVDAGAPRGDVAPPAAPEYSDEWQIGTPDLIVGMDEPFELPATGIVDYQFFKVPTHLTEDTWVEAIEIRPGDPRAVHHLRVFAQAGPDLRQPGPGELCLDEVCGDLEPPLIGWGPNIASVAVGTGPDVYPAGTAKLLKAGTVLTLHVHYTTTGVATKDQTRVAFRFAKTPPRTALKTVSLAQERFNIPPGAPNHAVEASIRFTSDVLLWSLGPHSHLRGKSWRMELHAPDGIVTPLLSVPQFDFNWQLNYLLAEPLKVKAGSRIHAVAVYDNSRGNPDNPNPDIAVTWGGLTTDEMMFASVVYSVVDSSSATPPPR